MIGFWRDVGWGWGGEGKEGREGKELNKHSLSTEKKHKQSLKELTIFIR